MPHEPQTQAAIVRALRASGYQVAEATVNLKEYEGFRVAAGHARYHEYRGGAADLAEKSLEHYLAAKFLDLGPGDVYIDVASYNSPAPDIYRRLYGCTTYRQDLIYPEGIVGDRIGGDAARMPLPAGFATKMALHNAFEHFGGDSDMRFIAEAGRVLRPGGRLCIVPLFLFDRYAIQTDPAVHPRRRMAFEDDAVVYCAKGWRNRHGRFYDIPHLDARVRDHLGGLGMRVIVITNERQVQTGCYVKFLALFERA